MSNNNKHITQQLSLIPEKPGVYQFFDSKGKQLYIGKARNLQKRVSSYFNKNTTSGKTAVLVSKIHDIQHIIVQNESEALLLENSLVKQHQPRYNILLKDDKTFPWICIKNEPFPRVFYTRRIVKDGSQYFGPFTNIRTVKTLLDLIGQLYRIRNCNYNLSTQNIKKKKFKVCLEYHIGNCKGPCEGLQSEEDYMEQIVAVRDIIRGDLQQVQNYLTELMKKYSEQMRFEQANEIKEKIFLLKKYQSRSVVVSPDIKNVDVFAFADGEKSAFVTYLKVVNGAVVQVHSMELKKKIDEDPADMLASVLVDIRQRLSSTAEEIILPFELGIDVPGAKTAVPQRGDKKKLLDLAERNLKQFKMQKELEQEGHKTKNRLDRILQTIKYDLRMDELPKHIECFDNSNIQGSNPVAACVVFKNTKPAKKEYRHFNIKTVSGPDDYASMEEVIYRRYKRLIDEQQPMPQLIVIDGGKGQLAAAMKALEKLQLTKTPAVIGIAKRLEEIFFPNDNVPLYLDKGSETLKIIQHIRNEAHRFGIGFHRDKRSKNFIKSELENIPGLGEKSINALLTTFKSVEKIKEADIKDIEKVLGKDKAAKIRKYLAS